MVAPNTSQEQTLQQADEAFRQGHLDQARQLLGSVAAEAPGDAAITEALASLSFQLGDYEGARAKFEQAAKLRPDHAPTQCKLAATLARLARYEEFETVLGQALFNEPENREALKLMANTQFKRGQFADAAIFFEKLARLNPGDAGSRLALGVCLVKSGDLTEARTVFSSLLADHPENDVARQNLAVVDQQLEHVPAGNGHPLPHSGAARTVPLNPIVIGAPRTGFTLLIGVANAILNLKRQPPPPTPTPEVARRMLLKGMVELSSYYLTRRYEQTYAAHGYTSDVVFNGEFHLLVGGPKWLDPEKPERACIRKYMGLKGQGDFLLITSHPREVMEYYDVIHSHLDPPLWLAQDYYAGYKKLASVRNPIGVINSASFSLNAMASEYIQKFVPDLGQDFIRQRHGLYKLSDLNFVRGLAEFLKKYFDQYLPVRGQYAEMKWEDLIKQPVETIQQVAGHLGTPITPAEAAAIWKPMDHQNTLQYHKHNFRRGKGIVGDWKNSLVNEHMDIFRELGYDDYLEELGYPPVPTINPRDYSPYQKLVASHIQRGDIYHNTGDPDLFGFAFNKSNIDASQFNFKSLPKREWTHVERTTVKDEAVVEAISDAAEDGCAKVNAGFLELLAADFDSEAQARRATAELGRRFSALMGELDDPEGEALCRKLFGAF